VIDLDIIRNSNHVARIYELESDLSSVVFRNADGTNTMYMWGSPVQFTAEDDSVRDKSNRLYSVNREGEFCSQTYAFVNRDNDIKTYFPQNLTESTGILLTDGDIKIERSPIFDNGFFARNSAGVENRDEYRRGESNWVYYGGVFGRYTALRYSPTFEGFKEEVVLERNVGTNRFSFTVQTNGLELVYDGGAYSLIKPGTCETVGGISGIYVYDSSERGVADFRDYRHFYETEVIRANEEYIVTIVVDEQFLENAVYPVYVDPTTTIDRSLYHGTKQIQDAAIIRDSNQQLGVTAPLTAGALLRDTPVRTLMRFPGLGINSGIRHIPASHITNATLVLYNLSVINSPTPVYVHRYAGIANWEESTVHGAMANVWSFGAAESGQTLSTGAANRAFSFSILEAVKHWKGHLANNHLNRGIVIRNGLETDVTRIVNFHATESANASARPRLEITWKGFVYVFETNPNPPDAMPVHVSSRYGDRPPPAGGGTTEHKGVDITASRGTALRSVDGGNLRFASMSGNGALGGYVVIQLDAVHPLSGQRLRAGYAHLDSIPQSIIDLAAVGGRVTSNVTIGRAGSTGTVNAHLHFQVMTDGGNYANSGNYRNTVNPLQYFPEIAFTFPNQSTPDAGFSRTHRRCRGTRPVSSSVVDYVPHPPVVARCPTCNVTQP
jgi:murein DD-endopeptidase MepM/ murein hydrolase activator NlpD